MGLPICRDPPAEPRETERDPTASARSNIRRRLHRRRNGGTSDVLRRNSTRLDQDRRSSQQVLLDLLQFTSQDNNNSSSSSTSNSGLTSAATTASSTVNAVSVGAGSPAASQAWYRRGDATAFPPLFSTERERRGDPLDPPVRGTAFDEAYSLLPPFLSPGLRIIRHSSTGELTLPPDRSEQDREQGRGQEREFEREFEREALERLRASMERNREQNERFAREFRNRPHMLWSSRPGNSSNTDAEELPSYLRESSRRVERAAQFMQSMREQMRELNNTIPDVMAVSESGRSRGSQIDGLGDRDRSLSPDRSAWYFPNPAFPDLGMHCEYASDGESDGDEDRAGWIDTVTRPRTPVWGEVVPSRPDSALERFRSRRAALLLLRNEVSRAGGRGDESPLRVNITGEP